MLVVGMMVMVVMGAAGLLQRRIDSMREQATDQQRTIQALTDRVSCLEELNQTSWQKQQAMSNLYEKKLQNQQELIDELAQQLNANRRIHDN
jgi:predicted RNase H-like nuclease (RuvC/YqgF family)